jgi:hypothetical protein
MKKTMTMLAIAALSFGLSGCRMCCPSYDYVGPTDPGTCNNENCGHERRGSIFSGYSETVAGGEVIVEDGAVPEGTVIESAPTPPAVPKPPAPTTKPMSYGDGKQAQSTSARRTR